MSASQVARDEVAVRVSVLELRQTTATRAPECNVAIELASFEPNVPRQSRTLTLSKGARWSAEVDFVMARQQLDDSVLTFRVWDAGSVGRGLIGQVAIPLSELPLQGSHAHAEETWYQLEGAIGDRSARHIKLRLGFIPASAAIITPPSVDFEHSSSSALPPAPADSGELQPRPRPGRPTAIVHISSIAIANAPCDSAFVVITFSTSTFRTKLIRRNKPKTQQQQVLITVRDGERHLPVRFALYERNLLSSTNELLGAATVPISDLAGDDSRGIDLRVPLEARKQPPSSSSFAGVAIELTGRSIAREDMKQNVWTHLTMLMGGDRVSPLELWAVLNLVDLSLPDDLVVRLVELGRADDDDSPAYKAALLRIFDAVFERTMEEPTDDFLRMAAALPLEGATAAPPASAAAAAAAAPPSGYAAIGAAAADDDANEFVLSGFLTEAQARKGRLTRLVNAITNGTYDVGADSANVLVIDRATGQLVEEKIPTSIRMSIRAIYKTKISRKGLDSKLVKSLFGNLTYRQGKKYDDPKSASAIRGFCRFHEIDPSEFLDPIESFNSFNEFFYRKLRPGSRRVSSSDPRVAVSPADCRLMAFQTVAEATQIWIKGSQFSLEALLQDKELASYFEGGAVVVCRLAPQDYHRFHSPVDGVAGKYVPVPGTYLTVNPMAVREKNVDVFTDNKRTVMVIQSPQFDKVGYVIVGAMLVGSINITSPRGTELKRLDEIGYFAFGGSTIIVLFRKGAIVLDEDLLDTSRRQLETLVRVGSSIGRTPERVALEQSQSATDSEW